MKGIKKFNDATEEFLDKASALVKDKSQDMTLDMAKEVADFIYKVQQSLKLMQDKPKGKKDEEPDLSGKSLADRMSKNGN